MSLDNTHCFSLSVIATRHDVTHHEPSGAIIRHVSNSLQWEYLYFSSFLIKNGVALQHLLHSWLCVLFIYSFNLVTYTFYTTITFTLSIFCDQGSASFPGLVWFRGIDGRLIKRPQSLFCPVRYSLVIKFIFLHTYISSGYSIIITLTLLTFHSLISHIMYQYFFILSIPHVTCHIYLVIV